MSKKNTPKQHARVAAEAHTTLVLFASVERMLESNVYGVPARATAAKIIALCQREQARQLAIYDDATAMVEARTNG
jgi:hypothetical protein